MTPDKDGWIKHDGGPCPVAPGRLVMVNGGTDIAIHCEDVVWSGVTRYRTFARVNPPERRHSPFVRETAAQIMASAVTSDSFLDTLDEGDTKATLDATAAFAVRAALALEAELGRIGK